MQSMLACTTHQTSALLVCKCIWLGVVGLTCLDAIPSTWTLQVFADMCKLGNADEAEEAMKALTAAGRLALVSIAENAQESNTGLRRPAGSACLSSEEAFFWCVVSCSYDNVCFLHHCRPVQIRLGNQESILREHTLPAWLVTCL